MRIGFDAKRAFLNNTGLGNYSRDTIRLLSRYYQDNKYFLYTPKEEKNSRLSFLENSHYVNKYNNIAKNIKDILKFTDHDSIENFSY